MVVSEDNNANNAVEEPRPPRIGRMVEIGEADQLRWLEKHPPPPRIGRMIEESLWQERLEKGSGVGGSDQGSA